MRLMRLMMKSHFLKRCSLSERLKRICLMFQFLVTLGMKQAQEMFSLEKLSNHEIVYNLFAMIKPRF